MNDTEKLKVIEAVLLEESGVEACYPNGDIADGIIEKIRKLTGDENFAKEPHD